jgi:hypothetical protein
MFFGTLWRPAPTEMTHGRAPLWRSPTSGRSDSGGSGWRDKLAEFGFPDFKIGQTVTHCFCLHIFVHQITVEFGQKNPSYPTAIGISCCFS